MEECEALCTRLVIMVNGEFKCLGSPQHLKSKFGQGYKLTVRLTDENEIERLYAFIKEHFPTASISEIHKNLTEYTLPFKDTKLSEIFGCIEKNRDCLGIKDYSVSQTTLDQVFVNFAKGQDDTMQPQNGVQVDDENSPVNGTEFASQSKQNTLRYNTNGDSNAEESNLI
jgi:ABC-type multidrug transport system ATPase subunit